MEFCPKCEVRQKNDNGLLSCPKCKYVKEKTDKFIKEKPEETNSEFLVMDESDLNQAKGLESTIKIDCEKCHEDIGIDKGECNCIRRHNGQYTVGYDQHDEQYAYRAR